MIAKADNGDDRPKRTRTEAAKKKGTKRGRPEGAKTADRPVIDITPTPCRHCQAITQPTNLNNKHRIEGSGRTADGRQYGAVILRSGNCGACGLPVTAREYEFLP